MCKTVSYIKKYDVIISFHSSHYFRNTFHFRRKTKEIKTEKNKKKVEREMGDPKKLRELRGSYEILNSHERIHITTQVNANKPSKTRQYVQKTAVVMH